MSFRPHIKPEILRWARDRAGVPLELAVSWFPKYAAWESGDERPTMAQLQTFASKTRTPLGYFFLSKPPEETLPIPDYRTVGDRGVTRPSPNLLATVYAMQRRQDWMREYLIEQGAEPLPFIGSATIRTPVAEVAASIRKVLGLDAYWAQSKPNWEKALRYLTDASEDAGILVVQNGVVANNTSRKLNADEFRGFVLSDPYAPLIFINRADALAAQMFTVAHELAHLWLGQDGVFNLQGLEAAPNKVEGFCNRVAAEFLVPEMTLRTAWQEGTQSFQQLAKQFKVSELVAARRALDLGLVTRDEFFAFYNEYQAEDRRKQEAAAGGGNFYYNQPFRVGKRFAEAVMRATKEGRLLYRDAYRLTDLNGRSFHKYAHELGLEL